MTNTQESDINRIIEAVQLLKGAFYEAGASFGFVGPENDRIDRLMAQVERDINLEDLIDDLEHIIKYGAK